jgi:hypothetical protein
LIHTRQVSAMDLNTQYKDQASRKFLKNIRY